MIEEFILKWEEVIGVRVVSKEKVFSTAEKRDQFRREIMQKKSFFKLIKGD